MQRLPQLISWSRSDETDEAMLEIYSIDAGWYTKSLSKGRQSLRLFLSQSDGQARRKVRQTTSTLKISFQITPGKLLILPPSLIFFTEY